MSSTTSVFLVDDDAAVRGSVSRLLSAGGHEVHSFESAEAFLAQYQGAGGCLVLDVHLGGMPGPQLHEHLTSIGAPLATIFISGHADEALRSKLQSQGAVGVLNKPVHPDKLLSRVDYALGLIDA